MYKNILIPLAYEPGHPAKAEIAAAKSLAAPGAQVTLLHVLDPVPKFAAAHLPESAQAEMRNTVEHDLQRHADTLLGADIRIVEGEPGRQIISQASDLGADCIVMASHRTHKGEYGSTTARVVRHAPCTVHLLR